MGFDTVSVTRAYSVWVNSRIQSAGRASRFVPNAATRPWWNRADVQLWRSIQITPFQLASLAAAFANGGTLYYLQYPRTAEEIQNFEPRIKRDLNIATVLPEIREGMLAAVSTAPASAVSIAMATKCRSAKPEPATTRLPA